MPLIWAEAADQEKHHTHANVGEHYTHPNLIGKRVQEGENARLRLGGLLDHDGDPKTHKGFGEVDDFLSHQCDGQWCHGHIGFLQQIRYRVTTIRTAIRTKLWLH